MTQLRLVTPSRSTPDKRPYRRSEVLVRHMSGNATNQELAAGVHLMLLREKKLHTVIDVQSNNTGGLVVTPAHMNSESAALFTAVDDYVRLSHLCFVSECDPNRDNTMWTICIRPTNENSRVLDRYACKYIDVTLREAQEISTSRTLSSAFRQKIDSDLDAITGGRT
jgi:hypothetical protein